MKKLQKVNVCKKDEQHKDENLSALNSELPLDQLENDIQNYLWNSYVLIVAQHFLTEFNNVKKKKSFNRELLCSGITWERYILSQAEVVQKMVANFRLKRLMKAHDNISQAEDEISNHLPKGFKEIYTLIHTTGDGSCFFHAISLSLFQNEKYSNILRFCTLFHLVKFRNKLQNYLFDDEGYLIEAKGLSLTPQVCKSLRMPNQLCFADISSPLLMSEILRKPILIIQGDRRQEFETCIAFDELVNAILLKGNDHSFVSTVARSVDMTKEPLVLSLFANHYTAVLKKCNVERNLPVIKYNVMLDFDSES